MNKVGLYVGSTGDGCTLSQIPVDLKWDLTLQSGLLNSSNECYQGT